MLRRVYRILLCINMLISTYFFFVVSREEHLVTTEYINGLRQLQVLLLMAIVVILVISSFYQHCISSRFFFGLAYCSVAITGSILFFRAIEIDTFWNSHVAFTGLFVAEVLLFAILLKNDFQKNYLKEKNIS